MKPCPACGGEVDAYRYDSGWRRVECDACDYIATPAENLLRAVQNHNARSEAARALLTPKDPGQ